MKKIIYITNTSHTLVSLRMNLMKSMKRDGYDVYAGAPRDKNSNIIVDNKISFCNIPMSQTGMNIIEEVRTIIYLIKTFLRVKPDIIHLYSIKAVVWGGLSAVFFPSSKVVSTFTGMGILRSCSERLQGVLFAIIRFSHNRNKKYIFQLQHVLPCKYCRDNFENNLKKIPLNADALKNRENFSKWMYKLHETVNRSLGKKSGLKFRDVQDRYEHFRARCLNDQVKTKKEKGCTDSLYGMKGKCILNIVPKKLKLNSFQIDPKCKITRGKKK